MSMTGRGVGAAAGRAACVEVELSSVNRRQLDLSVGLPRCLAAFESRVQGMIQRTMSRGRITGEIRVVWTESGQASAVRVDEGVARAHVEAVRAAAKRLNLPDDLKASDLLLLPDAVVVERRDSDPGALWSLVEQALARALSGLQAMRRKEGAALARDLRKRFKTLKTLGRRLAVRAPAVTEAYRTNLLRRIGAVLPERSWAEDERVLKEVALFADRSDVTEEQVRLDSHLRQADDLLKTGGVAGRTLDFLVQEMGREINTIGSKANDADITRLVIAYKAELERIREQAQNIE
ncbi:MAG: YicC family protein [Lentisphaerae bacterium]|nr:YicC family protein [Lentisphaerota bacterium]